GVIRQAPVCVNDPGDQDRQSLGVLAQPVKRLSEPAGELDRRLVRSTVSIAIPGPGLERLEAVADELLRRPAVGRPVRERVGERGERDPRIRRSWCGNGYLAVFFFAAPPESFQPRVDRGEQVSGPGHEVRQELQPVPEYGEQNDDGQAGEYQPL